MTDELTNTTQIAENMNIAQPAVLAESQRKPWHQPEVVVEGRMERVTMEGSGGFGGTDEFPLDDF